ncbi:MAG: efflux RND transporter periplasmic adaptor subunit [Caulobacterales bacterium]
MSVGMDRAVQRPKWRSRPAMIAAGGLGALILVVALALVLPGLSQRSVRVPAATVTIDPVQQGVFHDFTPLNGKMKPHDTIDLDVLEGGQVEKVMALAGDSVIVGQPLVAFRNTSLELDVLDREGRLIESITQLQSYEKQLEDTRLANEKAAAEIQYNIVRLKRSADRRSQLLARGYLAPETLDQIQDELTYDERLAPLQSQSNARQEALRLAQLPHIHAQLTSLQKDLAITRSKLDNLVVRAPVPGKLTDFDLNVGQNFNRGDRLGEVVPNTGFKVAANVDEYYLGRVQVGQIADCQINDQTWKLRVTRVYPQVKDATFVVDLAFIGPQPQGLLPGETITGRLSLGGDQPALVLPAGPFLERSGGDWVMVMTGDGRAERRRVKIGRRNAEQVEILSGLAAGDRVITSDYSAFEKIDRVDLTN